MSIMQPPPEPELDATKPDPRSGEAAASKTVDATRGDEKVEAASVSIGSSDRVTRLSLMERSAGAGADGADIRPVAWSASSALRANKAVLPSVKVKIGEEHQARIPPLRLKPENAEGAPKRPKRERSEREWQHDAIAADQLEKYMSECNFVYAAKIGLSMSPKAQEVAYVTLHSCKYDTCAALERFVTLLKLSESVLPHWCWFSVDVIRELDRQNDDKWCGWSRDDETRFVEHMFVVGKDLPAIARRMRNVSTKKVVRYYYEQYKQRSFQSGVRKWWSRLHDSGREPLQQERLRPKRVLSSLRVLASANLDGFSVDRCVLSLVTYFRDRRTWVKLLQRAQGTQ